jgi:hypothetical protein
MEQLQQLAELIRQRNQIDDAIADILGRPAEKGHISEYIAAIIFDIELCDSKTNPGADGYFRSGALTGRSVEIRYLALNERVLFEKRPKNFADFYLVLTGPYAPAATSKGRKRPFVIEHVFLFEQSTILNLPTKSLSIPRDLWTKAEIYPQPRNPLLTLTEQQREMLRLFGSVG